MIQSWYTLLYFCLFYNFSASGQEGKLFPDPHDQIKSTLCIYSDHTDYIHQKDYKDNTEKPFNIEAVYETADCESTLTSIQVNNAHFPLTWYELNEAGHRIHVLFYPQLNHLNNYTTYVVEDFSQHTDTIYIEFNKSLAIEKIYPNPHRSMIYLDYSAIDPTEMYIKIFDTSGKLVSSQTRILKEGRNQMTLDMSHLKQGVYFLALNGLCVNQLKKIIHLQ